MKKPMLSLLQGFLIPFSGRFWKNLLAGFKAIWRAIREILARCLRGEWHPKPRPHRTGCCIDLPSGVYKRADPLIYAQYYLISRGLAITWDNPDIDIFDGSVLVTGPLQANHHYRVRVRVWNGSYDAPAVGVGVELSYLSFGVQTVSHPIAVGSVNLGVKGTADCPAFLTLDWLTPSTGGHYCLQARLDWFDDANPDNNLGQKNVNVAPMLSPALFSFTVRNDAVVQRLFALQADAYELSVLPVCREERARPKTRLQESRALWAQARKTQSFGLFPVPDGWTVVITPQEFGLNPNQEQRVEVSIEANDPAFRGSRNFNVHVFTEDPRDRRRLVGGVTLLATRT